MAFRAGDFRVSAGQRISRPGVIEPAYVFPVRAVMARLAVLTELTLVNVLVAGHARSSQTQKALVEVFLPDQPTKLRLNVCRRMALPAAERSVFALQRVAGLRVVEFFLRWFPVNELKILTVVFGMAAHAVAIGIFLFHRARVEAQFLREPALDFAMAIQALEFAACAQLVATGALGKAGKRLVRFGKWTGGYLRVQLCIAQQRKAEQREECKKPLARPLMCQFLIPRFLLKWLVYARCG